MNKQEWYDNSIQRDRSFHKKVRVMLNKWRQDNGFTCKCVIHHRDDNDEVKSYNESHYELWGFNEDGTFEYGKYILFMTHAEHTSHHNQNRDLSAQSRGVLNGMYGKHHSDETCRKISETRKSLFMDPSFRAKYSGQNNPMYGKHPSPESNEIRREKTTRAMNAAKVLYEAYKNNGGILQWNDFRKALKAGEITFETRPVSVFVK